MGERRLLVLAVGVAVAAAPAVLPALVPGGRGGVLATASPRLLTPRSASSAAAVASTASRCLPDRPPAGSTAGDSDVGRLVVSSMKGPVLDGVTRGLLETQHLGGVLLFGANVRSAAQVKAMDTAIHAAGAGRPLVLVDQEGGLVRRLPFAAPVPAQAVLGKSGPAGVRRQFTLAGKQLRAVGIDVDLAPVADIGTAHGFEGSRTFPGPSGTVGGLVAAAVAGLRAGGVAATAKHFPGLGGVTTNTDVAGATGRPVGGADLVPFEAAIAAKVPLVMVDLARHPGLGPKPAALSTASYHVLRDVLGFQGVAVTDALDAGAARAVAPEPAAAVAAVCAGADLVLVPGGPAVAAATIGALRAAERSGALPRSRVAAALARLQVLPR